MTSCVLSPIRASLVLVISLSGTLACGSESTTQMVASPSDAGAMGAHAPPGTPLVADAGGPAPLAPACAGDGPSFSATYRVPVATSLEPYSSFPVSDVQYCARQGSTQLSYDLPELLVGKSTKVSFHGAYDAQTAAYRLSSSDGDAVCVLSGSTWTCREQFINLRIDTTELDQQLSTLPPAEASVRRDVASTFGQDPIGVLTFSAP